MNCKLIIKYDGSKYFGSQKQPKYTTVESTLQKALSVLNIDTKIIFSGRTDRNVHASGQVVSIQVPNFWNNLEKLRVKLNHILDNSIYIKNISIVDDKFHARFSAKKRSYRYIICTNEPNPFYNNYITYTKSIDEQRIKEAIKYFEGTFDFVNFTKEGSDPNSTIRTIYEARFYKYKDFFIFKFTANSFLRSQIRLIVGFLLAISEGKKDLKDLKLHLNEPCVSNSFKKPALANGLYLSHVRYN